MLMMQILFVLVDWNLEEVQDENATADEEKM